MSTPTREPETIKSAIESLIFIANKPLTIDELRQIFDDMEPAQLRLTIDMLKNEYESRMGGIRIVEIAADS